MGPPPRLLSAAREIICLPFSLRQMRLGEGKCKLKSEGWVACRPTWWRIPPTVHDLRSCCIWREFSSFKWYIISGYWNFKPCIEQSRIAGAVEIFVPWLDSGEWNCESKIKHSWTSWGDETCASRKEEHQARKKKLQKLGWFRRGIKTN